MRDICIFDFDGSVTTQQILLQRYCQRTEIVDLHSQRNVARLWTRPAVYERLAHENFSGRRPYFSLLGSGDYHHFSLALIANQEGPLTVVLFDNHPDWMRPPHRYHCGTWVYSLARLPQVERIVIVGLESGDLDGNRFAHGDLESYASGKIVFLPTLPITATIPGHGTVRLESNLQKNPEQGIAAMLAAITTERVYVSIDKDCLRSEDACTNWEQGTLDLDFVLRAMAAVGKHHVIVGADTVGDYSPPLFRSPFKWVGSLFDRPRNAFCFSPPLSCLQRNEVANLKLLNVLDECH